MRMAQKMDSFHLGYDRGAKDERIAIILKMLEKTTPQEVSFLIDAPLDEILEITRELDI